MNERTKSSPVCADGKDNDRDAKVDNADGGCRGGMPWLPVILE